MFGACGMIRERALPSLRASIIEVVCVCADEEMIRVDAVSHVALVQHELSVGNVAFEKLPRDSMRKQYTRRNPERAVAS